MGSIDERNKMQDAPTEGKITDEAIAAAKAMIGLRLRPEGPYLQDVTIDTIRNFCNGVGDLNPLYRDCEYGRNSRYASVIAPPMFPMAYGWLGRTRWGLPGVHGFYAGNDWELFRNLRPGDRISAEERVVAVDERQSEFSGRLVIQYVEAHFLNQHDDLIARVLGWCTRHERKAARDKGKYKDVKTHEYTAEELGATDRAVVEEDRNICGRNIRYWEDVEEGQELTPIARGPLSMMDTMGFLVGCGRGHTHGVLLKGALRHPGHFFRNPEAGGGVEYTGIGHHRESVAKEVGVPGVYDYGPQRSAWVATLVTNWMGDAGFLKRIKTELRRFNTMGDTTWCKGKVVRKYKQDDYPLVDIDVWAENQRGEKTVTNGGATVILPSKDIKTRMFHDGSGLDLGYAIYK
ncbi:MAG: MaoC family dehydratase N-terminal domain-containing protein [Betaproteobacteria bacterium]|nr:MaoC family dehydratase N-terminal domain-containing protein [Betaproteobacteria bacterium]